LSWAHSRNLSTLSEQIKIYSIIIKEENYFFK